MNRIINEKQYNIDYYDYCFLMTILLINFFFNISIIINKFF